MRPVISSNGVSFSNEVAKIAQHVREGYGKKEEKHWEISYNMCVCLCVCVCVCVCVLARARVYICLSEFFA